MKKISAQAKRHNVKKAMKGQNRWTTPTRTAAGQKILRTLRAEPIFNSETRSDAPLPVQHPTTGNLRARFEAAVLGSASE